VYFCFRLNLRDVPPVPGRLVWWSGDHRAAYRPAVRAQEDRCVPSADKSLAKAHGGGWQGAQGPIQRELTVDAHDTGGR